LVDELKHVSLRAGTPIFKATVSQWIYRMRARDFEKANSYQWLLLKSMTLIGLAFHLRRRRPAVTVHKRTLKY